jgi:hypothetical protein
VEARAGQLSIQSDLPVDRIELVSARGETRDLGTGKQTQWSTEGFTPGVYFLKVRAGSVTKVERVLLNL